MLHPHSHELLAYGDDALPPARRAAIRAHLATCLVCRREVARIHTLSASFDADLLALDEAEPTEWVFARPARAAGAARAQRVRRVRAGRTDSRAETVQAPNDGSVRRTAGGASRALRRSAAVFVLLTASAAAAVVFGGGGRAVAPNDPEEFPFSANGSTTGVARVAAVSTAPAAGAVRITITGFRAASRIEVVRGDFTAATLRVESVQAPRFTAGDGVLGVALDGHAATLHILLPRSARTADVTVDGRLTASLAADGRLLVHAWHDAVHVTEEDVRTP